MCKVGFGLNNNIIQNSSINYLRNSNHLNLNDTIRKVNTNYNYNFNNMANYYNINYPMQNWQCIYYDKNNMSYNIIGNRPQYSNYMMYYA